MSQRPAGPFPHEVTWTDPVTGRWYALAWDEALVPAGEVCLLAWHPREMDAVQEMHLPLEALRILIQAHEACTQPHGPAQAPGAG